MAKKPMLGFMMIAFIFLPKVLFAQEVEHMGIDVKAAVTAPVILSHSKFKVLEVNPGIGLSLVVGYRWYHGGLYIDQDFTNVFTKDSADKLDTSFMGSLHFVFRNFYAFHPRAQIYASMGIGFVYGSMGTRDIFGLSKYQVAFSIKGEFGISYAIHEVVGIGLDFVYAYAFVDDKLLSVAFTHHAHILTPSLYVNFYF